MGDPSADNPKGTPDFPRVPYEAIGIYADLLNNRDDFAPQVNGAIVRVGDREFISDNKPFPNLSGIDNTPPISISLPYPVHEAALSGMAASISEHLDLASTGISVGTDIFSYESDNITVTDFNVDFPDHQVEPPTNDRMDRVFVVYLFRKADSHQNRELALFIRPEYVVKNSRTYEQPTDQKFFADLYNEITVEVPDNNPNMRDFIIKYSLSGFPWPNRVMKK